MKTITTTIRLRVPDWLWAEADRSDIPVMRKIACGSGYGVRLTSDELRALLDEADYQAHHTDCEYAALWRRRYAGLVKTIRALLEQDANA